MFQGGEHCRKVTRTCVKCEQDYKGLEPEKMGFARVDEFRTLLTIGYNVSYLP